MWTPFEEGGMGEIQLPQGEGLFHLGQPTSPYATIHEGVLREALPQMLQAQARWAEVMGSHTGLTAGGAKHNHETLPLVKVCSFSQSEETPLLGNLYYCEK